MLSIGASEEDAIEQAKAEIATQHGQLFVKTSLGKFEAKRRNSVFGHKITIAE